MVASRAIRLAGIAIGLVQGVGCSRGGHAASDAGAPDRANGAPYLTSLRVESRSGGAGVALAPAFAPGIHDYSVRCVAGTNALAVSMAASPGASSSLVQPTASSPSPAQTVLVEAGEDDAIVVAATAAGEAAVEYWIRCLPHDFPRWTMDVHRADASAGVYHLLSSSDVPPGARWSYAILLDENGAPIWYAHGPSAEGILDADDLVPGAIAFAPQGSPIQLVALAPLVTTRATPSHVPLDPHELRVLSNGDFLVLSVSIQTGVDLSAVKVDLPDGGTQHLGPDSTVAGCDLVEFDPKTGAVAWTWAATDHFRPEDTVDPEVLAGPGGGPLVILFHCNSVDVDPETGNLLVSARDLNSIFDVERSTGKILWKVGGKPLTTEPATFVPVTDPFYAQHDARLLPGWSPTCGGRISLYDDHTGRSGSARALVLDVGLGASGCGSPSGAAPGAKVAWQYAGGGTAIEMGSVRIEPDGSRVIGWGRSSDSALPTFTDLDGEGNRLVDFTFTDGLAAYRVVPVPKTAFDRGVLRRTAGRN